MPYPVFVSMQRIDVSPINGDGRCVGLRVCVAGVLVRFSD